uniref:Alpha/beta hydrolase n=1 Tax=Oscillatoriales cyanobacterium SpSt-402 TaxID=2282168 RepID=A0A832M3R2_9CYAN
MSLKQTVSLNLNFVHSGSAEPAAFVEFGEGPTLLMLHGFMGSAACWLPLMEQLQSQVHCVALDLMGFGDSAKPRMQYDIAKEVEFVRRFLEARNLGQCYLLGHSFGGWVAAAYALAYPEQVAGLILAAPAGIRDDSFCGRYDHLRPILWDTPIVDWVLRGIAPLVTLAGHQETLKQITWMRRELMAQPAARSFLMDRLRPEDAIDTVEKHIHQLQTPTLVITGDRDETIPLWHSETYTQEIPNAKLVILPNADHSLPQNHAPELAELILPFLMQAEP